MVNYNSVTTLQIAYAYRIQHELIRDAAGSLFGRTAGTFTTAETVDIMRKLAEWKRLK